MFKNIFCLLLILTCSAFAQGSPSWNGSSLESSYNFLPLGGSTDVNLKPSYNGTRLDKKSHYGWTYVYNSNQSQFKVNSQDNTYSQQWDIEIDCEDPERFIIGENEGSTLLGLRNDNEINFYIESCTDQICSKTLTFTTPAYIFLN